MEKQTVLITGASSGIGYELARLFAKDKYDMILVSRSNDTLKEVADELKELGAGDVEIIAADLSIQGVAKIVYEETKRMGKTIDILVNDAGVGEFGYFNETDLEAELAIIQLNITSLVTLTKLFLKDMIAADRGKILQLGSVAAYQPTPKLAVYAATKSFVVMFSDAIRSELKDITKNVTITTLLPNATDTDFFRKAGMQRTKAAQDHPEDPEPVAQEGYKALMKGEPHAYGTGVKKQIAMSALLPHQVVAEMAKGNMIEEKEKK